MKTNWRSIIGLGLYWGSATLVGFLLGVLLASSTSTCPPPQPLGPPLPAIMLWQGHYRNRGIDQSLMRYYASMGYGNIQMASSVGGPWISMELQSK